MAKDLAQRLIDHRGVCLASDRIAEFRLRATKRSRAGARNARARTGIGPRGHQMRNSMMSQSADGESSVEELNRWIVSQFESLEGQAEWRRQIRHRNETEFACIGNESTRQRLRSELRRIERAIHDPEMATERRQAYWVARSTLAWCEDPEMFASPMVAADKAEKHFPLNSKEAD